MGSRRTTRQSQQQQIHSNVLAFTDRSHADRQWAEKQGACWKVRLGESEPSNARVTRVPLTRIDRDDHRFQCRFSYSGEDLVGSIERDGQQSPVILWGSSAPFKIIDGFRRIEALSRLERDSVLAILRFDLGEAEAFVLSFCENVRRKNLGAVEKAAAIWQAIHWWHLGKEEVAAVFSLSVRQIDRYLEMLNFPQALVDAVNTGRLSMAHAVQIRRAGVADASEWVARVEQEHMSARDLEALLARRRRRIRRLLLRDEGGFRLGPIRYRHSMRPLERQRICEALREALDLVQKND